MTTTIRYTGRCLFVALAIFLSPQGHAQSVSVTGPNCVIAGPVYLYTITGPWQTGSTVRVCVTGGTLVDSGATCAGGSGILSFVRVAWDSGGRTSGSVAVTTSLGNDSIPVTIAQPMNPGQIDSGVANQTLDTATTPATLTCSAPAGGGCSMAYQYQWQQSFDNVIWSNIGDATSAQLSFSGPLSQPTYFRRLTTNTVSNAFDLSNVATLWVNTPMPVAQGVAQ